VVRRRLVESARGGQLGGGIDQPRHDRGQRQQPCARRSRRHQLGGLDARVQPKAPGGAEHGGDVAVRQRAQDLKPLPTG
jgi:hypothetical protein